MDKIKLDEGLLEDLSMDLLPLINNKFNLKLKDDDLLNVSTFEDLISIIIHKTNLDKDNSCTSQQAFYKINF